MRLVRGVDPFSRGVHPRPHCNVIGLHWRVAVHRPQCMESSWRRRSPPPVGAAARAARTAATTEPARWIARRSTTRRSMSAVCRQGRRRVTMNAKYRVFALLGIVFLLSLGFYFFSTRGTSDVVLIGTVDANQVIVSSKVARTHRAPAGGRGPEREAGRARSRRLTIRTWPPSATRPAPLLSVCVRRCARAAKPTPARTARPMRR